MYAGNYLQLDNSKRNRALSFVKERLKRWDCYKTLDTLLEQSSTPEEQKTKDTIVTFLEHDLTRIVQVQDLLGEFFSSNEDKNFTMKFKPMYPLFVASSEIVLDLADAFRYNDLSPEQLQNYQQKKFSKNFNATSFVKGLHISQGVTFEAYQDLNNILAGYVDFLKFEHISPQRLALATYLFFSKLQTDIRSDLQIASQVDERLKGLLDVLEQQKIRIDGRIYAGLSVVDLEEHSRITRERAREKKRTEERYQALTKPVKVIGNEYALGEIDSFIKLVALYDVECQENILCRESLQKPVSMLLHGPPGTGKSTMLRYARWQLYQISEKKGIPYQEIILDNSYQDEYHGRDVKNLREKIRIIEDPSKIGIFIIDDLDGVIQSRTAKDSTHLEGKSLHTLMQWLDGLETSYQGNYLVAACTNHRAKIDNALLRRFGYQLLVDGPRTIEHYVQLFREETNANSMHLQIHHSKINALLDELRKKGCSGADIHHFAEMVNKYVNNLNAISEEIYLKPLPEQTVLLQRLKRDIDEPAFRRMIEDYTPRTQV